MYGVSRQQKIQDRLPVSVVRGLPKPGHSNEPVLCNHVVSHLLLSMDQRPLTWQGIARPRQEQRKFTKIGCDFGSKSGLSL